MSHRPIRHLFQLRWVYIFFLAIYLLALGGWFSFSAKRFFPTIRDPHILHRLQIHHMLEGVFLLVLGVLAGIITIWHRQLRRKGHHALQETVLGISAITGQTFCDSLCEHLAQALGMRHVIVGRFVHDHLEQVETVSRYDNGRHGGTLLFAADELPYAAGAPDTFSCARGARQAFPDSRLLEQFKAESCIVAVLRDSKGRRQGVMAAYDPKPLTNIELVESLFKVFVVRAAAELERKGVEEELAEQADLLQTIVNALPAPLFYKDEHGIYLGCNRAFEEFIGQPRDRIIGRSVYDVAPADLAEIYHEADMALMREGGSQSYETSVVYADGNRHEVIFHKAVFTKMDSSTGGLVGAMVDITERKKAEETIKYLAHFDPSTDLPNQILFEHRLAQELAESKRLQDKLAVLNLDIDQFKKLSSAFGQQTGDKLLRQVAARLSRNLRADDAIAKVGDDIFMVLLPHITDEEEAAQVAMDLLDNLRQAFILEGQEIFITASIGIALFPHDGLEPQDLIKSSTSAMHRAKDVGRNGYQFHSPELTAHTREEIDLGYQLYKALERDELLLYYQPIIEAQNNRIVAVEALLRWRHPQLGLLHPGRFIHLAEKTGLIVGIGEWVLRTACRQGRAWQDLGATPLRIGVNLSPRQFQQPDLFQSISQILLETGLPPERLSIEITENILMNNVEKAVETLSNLKQLGVHLAIDDFGTGYSSLNYIKRFPFDMLKIDRSFVAEIADHADDLAIVSAVVAMAESLNLSVLAEGVETDQQRQILCAQGCRELQGFLFSFPLPVNEIERLLFDHSPFRQSFAAAVP